MQRLWKYVAAIPDDFLRMEVALSEDEDFLKRAEKQRPQWFTKQPLEKNPLPLSLGRELCEFKGVSIHDLEILPIIEITVTDNLFSVPAGVKKDLDGDGFYYNLFTCGAEKVLHVEIMSVVMLLISMTQDEDGQSFSLVDPRYVDLGS